MSGDGPEYGWLYGGRATRPRRRERPRGDPAGPASRSPRPRTAARRDPDDADPAPPRRRRAATQRDPAQPATRRAAGRAAPPRRGGGRGRPGARGSGSATSSCCCSPGSCSWSRCRSSLDQHREGRVRARRRPAVGPAGHDVPPRRHRLARGPDEGGAQGAQHRQRRRQPHRHDHAAAHRRRAPTCSCRSPVTPSSTSPGTARTRSTPPTRSAAPRCSSRRSRARPASGSTSTSRSGWAGWPASSTRSAASRCAPSGHGRQAGRAQDQEGLPGGRRRHRAGLRPVPAHSGHR